MTDEEKFEMYMKVPHEELVRMKIESEKYEKLMNDNLCYCHPCSKRCEFYLYKNKN